MGYGFKVELWGDYALFTRPEFKVERVSYDVITPSAARGILEAIYWKPAIRYVIDSIHVYHMPKFTNIRRNEVKDKISKDDAKKLMEGSPSAKGYLSTSQSIAQRASMVLQDVRYVIEAHFEMTDKAGETDTKEKHYNVMLRRLRNGQCFHQPSFGCREFTANFRIIEEEIPKSELIGEMELGYMLYDLDYSNTKDIQPIYFKAKLVDGLIDLRQVVLVR